MRQWCVFLFMLFGSGFPQTETEVREEAPVAAEEPEGEGISDSTASGSGEVDPEAKIAASAGDTAETMPDIGPLIKTARRNFEKGQFQAAEKAATLALDISPRDYEAVKLKGMAAYRIGNLASARESFETARTALVKDAEFDFFNGALHAAAGDFGAAETEFLKHKNYSSFNRHARGMKKCLSFVQWKAARQRARQAVSRGSAFDPAELDPLGLVILPGMDQLSPDSAALVKGISEAISLRLSRIKRLTLAGRDAVQALGEGFEEGPSRLGQLLKAENVVELALRADSAGWTLSGKLFDAVTATATDIAAVRGAPDSLLGVERDFSRKILEALDLPPTPGEREGLTRLFGRNPDAFFCFSTGLDAEDRGDFPAAAEEYRQAKNFEPGFKPSVEALRRAERRGECAGQADLTRVPPLGFFEALME